MQSKIGSIKLKICQFGSGNGFGSAKLHSLQWLVKGAATLCNRKELINSI
jgi:hypothetical protein